MACATNTPALKSPIKTAVSSIMARILHTQPALVTSLRYQPVCFRMISSRSENGFVARFCSSSARSRTQGSRVFYPAVFTVRGCKPDQGCRRIWKATAWTDVSHCIAGATDGLNDRRRNVGEVIKFVSRAELERMRLNRIARTRSGGLMTAAASVAEAQDRKSELADS